MIVGIGGPYERFGVVIGLGEKALDGGLEIDEGSEDAALQSSLAEFGKKALDGIEPGGRFGWVMEHEARMAIEPGAHLGVLVAAVIIIIEDDVDELVGRDLGLDRVEEADEFLMPVALHAAAARAGCGLAAWICDFSSTLNTIACAGGST
jgi:hypothetical protein